MFMELVPVWNFCNPAAIWGCLKPRYTYELKLYINIFMELLNKMALLQKHNIWLPYSTFEVILSGRTYPPLFVILPFQQGFKV
jgi:hypothetical protein